MGALHKEYSHGLCGRLLISHAKTQRLKEKSHNTAMLCVFAPLRESYTSAKGTIWAKHTTGADFANPARQVLSYTSKELIVVSEELVWRA